MQITKISDYFSSTKNFYLLVFAVILYITYWSYIGIYRIITFQAGVYDLGLMEQEFYLTIHSSSLMNLLINFLNKDTSDLFAPLYFFHNIDAIVIFQSIFLGTPAFLIYAISQQILKNNKYSLMFSFLYLVYPLLYGVNWFDVHNQAFIIFFFLLGFYLFLIERYILSTLFMLISGLTHYLLLGIPILFALPLIYDLLISHDLRKKSNKYGLIIFLSSIILLVLTYFINQSINISIASTVHAGTINVIAYLPYKLLTLILIFMPLGFLSIYPNKYILLMLPFIFIMLSSSQTIYFFPAILTDQYAAAVIPGVFISGIYGFSKLMKKEGKAGVNMPFFIRSLRMSSKKLFFSAILCTVILVIIIAPFTPLVDHSDFYKTELSTSKYSILYKEFSTEASLIPPGTPYIAIGDDEPTLLPIPQLDNAPLQVIPYTITSNLTYRELIGGEFYNSTINYVIGNPYGSMFTQNYLNPYNLSMFDLINRLFESGKFGIVAEASGIILLEKNYTGSLKYYVPIICTFDPAYMRAPLILGNIPITESNYIETNNIPILVKDSSTVNGPMFLPAGVYDISFSVSSNHTVNLNAVNFSANRSCFNVNFTSSARSSINQTYYLSEQVMIPRMVEESHLNISLNSNVSLFINSFNITQVSAIHRSAQNYV